VKRLLLLIFLLNFANITSGQNFSVPDSILKELQLKEIKINDSATFKYKIVYPSDYDDSQKYPVILGLSGGPATEPIVDFCYYTMFRSEYLKSKVIILPVAPPRRSLAGLDSSEIKLFLHNIMRTENIENTRWVLVGSSMGGLAAFNFAKVEPRLFEGIIVLPGAPQFDDIPVAWSNYQIVLAVGEVDTTSFGNANNDNWRKLNSESETKLKGKVGKIQTFIMKGQGHIVSPDYNIDLVYENYFKDK